MARDVEAVGLPAATQSPHDRALAALDDPQASSLEAVTWLAVHLSAVERALYPEALHAAPSGRNMVRMQLRADRRLQSALWELDRRLTGDIHFARDRVEVLEARVRECLEEHAEGERAIVETLTHVLDDEQQRALEQRLADVMMHAPTRPHPDTPHMRLTNGLAFRLDALADRARDLMDNRPTPTPRTLRSPRRFGRWGAYLMAAPYPDEPKPSTATPVQEQQPQQPSPG